MSIKKIALAITALAFTATAASADSYFSFSKNLENTSTLELGTVRSASDGVVEIHRYTGGKIGALLGTEDVNAGANSDVRVTLGSRPNLDVIALLKIDGQVVAQRTYDIER